MVADVLLSLVDAGLVFVGPHCTFLNTLLSVNAALQQRDDATSLNKVHCFV